MAIVEEPFDLRTILIEWKLENKNKRKGKPKDNHTDKLWNLDVTNPFVLSQNTHKTITFYLFSST